MSESAGIRRVLERRGRTLALLVVGVALLGAGILVGDYETVLFVWGGTALFGAVLLALFGETTTVRSEVATDVYATLADNCREVTGTDGMVYAPGDGGVRLVTATGGLAPTGAALVDRIEAASVTDAEMTSGRLQTLVDGMISELELVDRATGETGDGEARVTASGCRIGTDERFDHPVASVVGVGLARTVDGPVRVETDVEDRRLVVSASWGDVDVHADGRRASDADEGDERPAPAGASPTLEGSG